MTRQISLLVKTAMVAGALMMQMNVVGAYWVCDICGCHINHEGCWFYDHQDVCHSGDSGDCYIHPRTSCGGGDLE